MEVSISTVGFLLVIFGFVLAMLAVVLMFARVGRAAGETRGGGVLLIGPIPIVFGTDRKSAKALMVLAIVLIIIFFVFMLLQPLIPRR